jgi:hypothetical protein
MKAEGPGGAGVRARERFLRSPVARGVLASGAFLLAFVLVVALAPRPAVPVATLILMEDTNSLRQLAAILADAGPPLAADGRIDVYGAVLGAGFSRDELLTFCRSRRSGRRPTAAEIEARDYANFPWQRRAGPFDPAAAPPVPILWEREPTEHRGESRRIVAYSDGWVHVLVGDDDEAMQEFLRRNPGQE